MGRRLVSDKVVSDDIVGTNGYHAPEVLFDDSYDIRADIFMLGITFCVMVGTACVTAKPSAFCTFSKMNNCTWISVISMVCSACLVRCLVCCPCYERLRQTFLLFAVQSIKNNHSQKWPVFAKRNLRLKKPTSVLIF